VGIIVIKKVNSNFFDFRSLTEWTIYLGFDWDNSRIFFFRSGEGATSSAILKSEFAV
jgi:hypothetical protein